MNQPNQQWPKSKGAIWPNNKKILGDPATERQPDHKGHVEVTQEQISMMVEQGRRGEMPTLQLAVWHKTAQQGGAPYMFVSTEVYMKEQQAQPQYPPQQPPAQQYQQPVQQQPQGFRQPQAPPQQPTPPAQAQWGNDPNQQAQAPVQQPVQQQPVQDDGFDSDSIPF